MYFTGKVWRKVNQQIIRILNSIPSVKRGRIVVALSGGMDSVFLLIALTQLEKKYKFKLLPVHINHGIQQEAKLFEKIAQHISRELGYECQTFPIRKRPKGKNLEEWLREERYRLLENYRKKLKADFVAVAHHASDQAETVLAHIIRGSGLRGLQGMLPVRGRIIRPLLDCTKKDIKILMEKSNFSYYNDKLNYSLIYQRNKIRHRLIPFLEKEFNPKITDRLAKLAKIAQKYFKDTK